MTIQEAAQTALDVQDASNLSGALRSMNDIVFNVLWPIAHETGKGTQWVNTHPIVTLFLDKLASLNGGQITQAWDEVSKLAAE